MSSPWSNLIAHVRQALGIPAVIPPLSHLSVAQPILFLDALQLYTFCPVNGCNHGFLLSSGNVAWSAGLKSYVKKSAACREALNICLVPQTNQAARKARTKSSQPRECISWGNVASTPRVVYCQRGSFFNGSQWLLCLPDNWLPPESATIASFPNLPKGEDHKETASSSKTGT